MTCTWKARLVALAGVCACAFAAPAPAGAQAARAAGAVDPANAVTAAHDISPAGGGAVSTRVTGIVRDAQNAVTLPGVAVEVVGRDDVVYTDLDGRYSLSLPPGNYELKVAMDGYQPRLITVEVRGQRALDVDIPLSMTRYAEEVTVVAEASTADASSAEAQILERKNAGVITDNVGSREMRANGDSDAASAMQRVTGLSVVDNQYVFVRGLGERYSNTTMAGAIVPTTEPDKKVVPLDLFPTALLESVQIAKSYSPDKPAEFAGGLVQVVPLKVTNRPVFDVGYGLDAYETSTGKSIPVSPLGNRDWLGYDNGARALPDGFPDDKVVRRGIYTPDVGYSRDEITAFGRLLDNRWLPQAKNGRAGQSFNLAYGNRFGNLGVLASLSQNYRETYVEETRRFFRLGEGGALEPVTDYDFQTGTQRAQLGAVASLAYQFSPNHRVAFENFYTHTGRDEGRVFEGPNTENNQYFRNYRLSFVEEGLLTNQVSGEHFVERLGSSRIDWRASLGRATRDEPDLRETLYQTSNLTGAGTLVLADESQSGFRLFQDLDDDTIDLALNWSVFSTLNGQPLQVKFGPQYARRTRDFASRRFRYIPTNAPGSPNLAQSPETLFAAANIGPYFRFNEETRPVDAYDAEQTTVAFYGMADMVLSSRARLVGGLRVERFEQDVNTFDPFGLFVARVSASLDNTDLFPALNLVYSLRSDMNLRLGVSQTVNRPEFRELAAFEFTDVVGNRAVRGNPALTRALIRNYDARWEYFPAARSVLAASVFYKDFEDPIERVINAGAQPLATFENAESARDLGIEIEAARQFGRFLYASANYTYVDSEVSLSEAARRVQTSLVRPLAGQSKNLFNAIGEVTVGGFTTRVLYNYFDDRIYDVGANGAPDIIEEGRGMLDLVAQQRIGRFNVRLTLENLTDPTYRFTQGAEDQRFFRLGRAYKVSFGYTFF